jgi:protein TonB
MAVQMSSHIDVLEQRDPVRISVLASVGLHAMMFTAVLLSTSIGRRGTLWGDPNALGGGAVGVTAVRQIPLRARSGPANPVANDTESRVPQPPKPQVKAVRAPEPDAIPIRGRKARERAARVQQKQQTQPYRTQPDRPNQLYSSAGQALSSSMYGSQAGSGGGKVGVGPRGSFGQRFGGYRDLLEQRVAQKWRTDDVDPRVQTAPPVIVTFDILNSGQIRNVRILQASGNRVLDYSAQRAVYDAAPFPPLPQGFERDTAQIEFWFQLKR